MKKQGVLFLTQAGLIAAIYVVLTVLLQPFAFSEVQVRISEMLCILPVFTPAAIPGLFIGCLIGNVLGGALLPDIIFGSLATLLAAYLTWKLRNRKLYVAALPPILVNAAVVPFILRFAYAVPLPIPLMMLTVGIGEVISVGVLGVFLGKVLEKNRKAIFGM